MKGQSRCVFGLLFTFHSSLFTLLRKETTANELRPTSISLSLLRLASTAPHASEDQHRRLDSFRCNAVGLLSIVLYRTTDERHLSSLRAMRTEAQLGSRIGTDHWKTIADPHWRVASNHNRIHTLFPQLPFQGGSLDATSQMSRPNHR